MITEIHNLQLEYELHTDILQRSLGRGGAPVNLSRAREELPLARGALDRISEALARDEDIPA
jgi:hypothetical protein